jgi:hypothetical protein
MDTAYAELHAAISAGAAEQVVPRWAAGYLGAVAAGQTPARAVRHPLGFLCLPAWRGNGLGICVHIWTGEGPPAGPTTSAVHAHSWDLISYVLFGRVRNRIVRVSDTGADPRTNTAHEPTHRVFEIHTGPVVDALRRTARLVRWHTDAIDDHGRGEVYTLPSGVFHTTVVDGYAATVALGRDRPGAVDLSLGGVHTTDHLVRRERCDPEQTRKAVSTVLANLGSPRLEDRCEKR